MCLACAGACFLASLRVCVMARLCARGLPTPALLRVGALALLVCPLYACVYACAEDSRRWSCFRRSAQRGAVGSVRPGVALRAVPHLQRAAGVAGRGHHRRAPPVLHSGAGRRRRVRGWVEAGRGFGGARWAARPPPPSSRGARLGEGGGVGPLDSFRTTSCGPEGERALATCVPRGECIPRSATPTQVYCDGGGVGGGRVPTPSWAAQKSAVFCILCVFVFLRHCAPLRMVVLCGAVWCCAGLCVALPCSVSGTFRQGDPATLNDPRYAAGVAAWRRAVAVVDACRVVFHPLATPQERDSVYVKSGRSQARSQ